MIYLRKVIFTMTETLEIELSDAELAEIDNISGGRWHGGHGWGFGRFGGLGYGFGGFYGGVVAPVFGAVETIVEQPVVAVQTATVETVPVQTTTYQTTCQSTCLA